MHRSESEGLASCAVCGAAVEPEKERAFVGVGARVLCFDCALARGGAWDDSEDRWAEAPSLAGLAGDDD